MLFCMGLVTGGTLIGVGKKFLNKWVSEVLLNFYLKYMMKGGLNL